MPSIFRSSRYLPFIFAGLWGWSTTSAAIQFQETTANGNFDSTESWGASWGDINGDLWPDLFVVNHRDRPSLFRNNADGTFTNVILQSDISKTWLDNPLIDTHGTAFADFDRDGDLDLANQTGVKFDGILMTNDGFGRFTDVTTQYGVNDDREGRTPQWLDFDLDGELDNLVSSGSMRLWQHTPTPPFPEISVPTGLAAHCARTQWGILTDIDGDDDMEYICAAEGDFPQKVLDYQTGTFVESSYLPTTNQISHGLDAAVADFNGDLYPDIFLTRGNLIPNQVDYIDVNGVNSRIEAWLTIGTQKGTRSFTFRSNGPVTLTSDSNQVGFQWKNFIGLGGYNPADDGGNPSVTTFTVDPADPLNEGLLSDTAGFDPDLPASRGTYIGYDPVNDLWKVTLVPGEQSSRGYFTVESDNELTELSFTDGLPHDGPIAPALLMNDGSTGFTNEFATYFSPFPSPMPQCVSVVAADFDNDRDLDLYLVCRGGIENIPNRLFENDGTGVFTEVALAGGAQGHVGKGLQSGAGTGENVVTADYDLDGLVDVFVTNGLTLRPMLAGAKDQLFKNTTNNSNHWVSIELEGTVDNIEGIGAKVYVTTDPGGTDEHTQLREQADGMHRWSQNDKRIHVGLGPYSTFDVEVRWPNGAVDIHTGVAGDQLVMLRQGDAAPIVQTPSALVPFPDPVAGNECGEPSYLLSYDPGVFVWKDCGNTDAWTVDVVGGTDTLVTRTGRVVSDQAFASITSLSLESLDIFDTNTPDLIEFGLTVATGGFDGFRFELASGASACLTFDGSDVPVYLGANHTPAGEQLNLDDVGAPCVGVSIADTTISEETNVAAVTVSLSEPSANPVTVTVETVDGTATAGADYMDVSTTVTFAPGEQSKTVNVPIWDDLLAEGDELFGVSVSNITGAIALTPTANVTIVDGEGHVCGVPSINLATEKGLFIWRDCGTNLWHMRATSGGQTSINHTGKLVSASPLSAVTPISFEANDSYLAAAHSLEFSMTMSGAGFDQLDFQLTDGGLCLVTQDSSNQIYLGANKLNVTSGVELMAANACPTLVVGTPETGAYGYGYGSNVHRTSVFSTFATTAPGFALELTVDGHDIDFTDEVEVLVNNTSIGYLTKGPNAGMQTSTLTINRSVMDGNTNMLEFRQKSPGWRWGVTNLSITEKLANELVLGTIDTGVYGHHFNGVIDHPAEYTTNFASHSTDLLLTVDGYDIDYVDEIEVLVNGTSIGYLAKGPNNGIKASELLIPVASMNGGMNTLTFKQRNPGWVWGITNLLIDDAALPALTIGVTDTSQYGHFFNGVSNYYSRFDATFASSTTDLELSVDGYDIDFADEIEVLVNNTLIGYLTKGPNLGLKNTVLTVPVSAMNGGTNTLSFVQKTPGWVWGITNILLSTTSLSELILNQIDNGEYGWYFNGNINHYGSYETTFDSDTVDLKITVDGFDIDFTDEVEVLVNNVSIGFLLKGPNLGLKTTVLTIPVSVMNGAMNNLTFKQKNPGWIWGVTGLLLEVN